MLRFRYQDHGGTASARVVEPHRLVNTGRRWYLVAWDTDRTDWRTFRVDRIQQRVAAGRRFTPREPPSKDLAAYVSRGVSYAPPSRARIMLLAPAELVSKRLPPGVGAIEAIHDDRCMLSIGSTSFENLAMHLGLIGVDFKVEEPQELVDEVRRIADRYRRGTEP